MLKLYSTVQYDQVIWCGIEKYEAVSIDFLNDQLQYV